VSGKSVVSESNMTEEIVLERDGSDQPWGFRLQGGQDVGLPLTVIKIVVGSPAEQVLRKGDVVTKIALKSTSGMSHRQVVEAFEKGGNQLKVTVKRNGSVPSGASTFTPPALPLSTLTPLPTQQSPQVAALPRTTFVPKECLQKVSVPVVQQHGSDVLSHKSQGSTPCQTGTQTLLPSWRKSVHFRKPNGHS